MRSGAIRSSAWRGQPVSAWCPPRTSTRATQCGRSCPGSWPPTPTCRRSRRSCRCRSSTPSLVMAKLGIGVCRGYPRHLRRKGGADKPAGATPTDEDDEDDANSVKVVGVQVLLLLVLLSSAAVVQLSRAAVVSAAQIDGGRKHYLSALEESLLVEMEGVDSNIEVTEIVEASGRCHPPYIGFVFKAFQGSHSLLLTPDHRFLLHTRGQHEQLRRRDGQCASYVGWLTSIAETSNAANIRNFCDPMTLVDEEYRSDVAITICNQSLAGHMREETATEVIDYVLAPEVDAIDGHRHSAVPHRLLRRTSGKELTSVVLVVLVVLVWRPVWRPQTSRRRRRRSSAAAAAAAAPPPAWPPPSRRNVVEVLVVVDGPMAVYHGLERVRPYVLTLMNMVALIYRDRHLGNHVDIAVVRVLVLDSDESFATEIPEEGKERPGPTSASEMLRHFCRWQKPLRGVAGQHYDVALLLTRVDICRHAVVEAAAVGNGNGNSNGNCDTLGLAELGTMCQENSCAVVQDNGLSAAFTIAHELGHVLNIPHDDAQKCVDLANATQYTKDDHVVNVDLDYEEDLETGSSASFVMSRMLDHNTNPWQWSTCSRHHLTQFLDNNHGTCLLNEARVNLLEVEEVSRKLPGEQLDADQQCAFVFGQDAKVCSYMPTCSRLWCTTTDGDSPGCRTQHMPWAEGTRCGLNKWCVKGVCVSKSRLNNAAVDGKWGKWGKWSACSRSCGGGIMKSIRLCNDPKPSNGGHFCIGARVRYESCNIRECESSDDFRLQQCQRFNGNNFNIQGVPNDVHWQPKFAGLGGSDRCKLFCRVHGSSAYYLLSSSVIDGTTCSDDTFDKCVNGQCVRAGCDNVLASGKKLDECGVCNGDNSTCVSRQGSFNQTRYGYSPVVRIPRGATNIEIRQYAFHNTINDDTYLALIDSSTNEYILNGDFVMSLYRKSIQYFGVSLQYSGSNSVVERINSSKPLKRDLLVEVVTVGQLLPPQVHYSYSISESDSSAYVFRSAVPRWSHCSRPCQGEQWASTAVCVLADDEDREVDEKHCAYLSQPEKLVKPCNLHCHLEWVMSEQSPCSVTCGQGFRNVSYTCVRQMATEKLPLPDHYCDQRPESRVQCQGECEGVAWSYGSWSTCSKSCGQGVQIRSAHCLRNERRVDDQHCLAMPVHTNRKCNQHPCPKWKTSAWTDCSVSCGVGVRRRDYWCVDHQGVRLSSTRCLILPIPRHIDSCVKEACVHWTTGLWSTCSESCGQGFRHRTVTCINSGNSAGETVDEQRCLARNPRPDHLQLCIGQHCRRVLDNQVEDQRSVQDLDLTTTSDNEQSSIYEGVGISSSSSASMLWPQRWKVGPWQSCSRSCGRGFQTRVVICFDSSKNSRTLPFFCKRKISKPIGKRHCNIEPCEPKAHWQILTNWSQCSTTCGQGVQTRVVRCLPTESLESNSVDQLCISKPPTSERVCPNNPECTHQVPRSSHVEHQKHKTNTSTWATGHWSQCSRTCGGGIRRRLVTCQTWDGVASQSCHTDTRPASRTTCNAEPCPRWNFGQWSQCDKSCDVGLQQRLVRCQDHLGETLPDVECGLSTRPKHTRDCNTQGCPMGKKRAKFLWKRSSWSSCSKSCGRGVMSRSVQCVDMNGGGSVVEDGHCLRHRGRRGGRESRGRGARRPRSRRSCNRHECPFQWVTEHWSECSHTCGKGVQHRRVTCHRVNWYGWIDPQPISHGCNVTAKPQEVQICVMANCRAKFHWRTHAWSKCSWARRGCGRRGRQRRRLSCVDVRGHEVQKRHCRRHLTRKPSRSRKCAKKLCGYESCLDLRLATNTSVDGEYLILSAGKNISVYCHQLNASSPKEYITLPSGELNNYAEIYGLRLVEPGSCPYNGSRNDSCACVRDASRREGLTVFSKLRVNVTSLKVNTHDFTFARQGRGEIVPYGEAGDCYSTANCPQGRFGIDLKGTGLRVSPYTGWVGQGNRPSLWLRRESDNQVIHGKCGGYCGTCVPEPHHGLKLDVMPPD